MVSILNIDLRPNDGTISDCRGFISSPTKLHSMLWQNVVLVSWVASEFHVACRGIRKSHRRDFLNFLWFYLIYLMLPIRSFWAGFSWVISLSDRRQDPNHDIDCAKVISVAFLHFWYSLECYFSRPRLKLLLTVIIVRSAVSIPEA